MKKPVFTAFDAADYLQNEEDIAAYLAAAGDGEDPQVLVVAMGDVIRAAPQSEKKSVRRLTKSKDTALSGR